MKKTIIFLSVFTLILGLIISSIYVYVGSFSTQRYFTQVSQLPHNEIGLVFGASVINNMTPSDILKDRLKVAARAYHSGKIHQIIVSGDNRNSNYNEPDTMKKYLISLGVQSDHIHPDYAGFDTYDSLYRAKEIFQVENLTLFTQDFHLVRALYIAQKLGIQSVGIETNLQYYLAEKYNQKREIFARVKAFLEIEILESKPKYLGDPIRIAPREEIDFLKNNLIENK